ncbi:hypothetical protein BD410DRAFT_836210 [Rickenella mellea]|uniref:Uncharacterized protein n=1 Tax=Rickenella mellea TaxID=50990 RepID=A0A4Y7QIR4_9AGAM|nr:hypothetical protein BD410DRAFT_836210 [Rickenella mellea]
MELKYLRRVDSFISKLKSSYDRIRRSRLFSAYVALTLVFCLLQATTELVAFMNDNAASSRFSSIIEQAQIPRRFAFLLPNNTILICDNIYGNQNCKVAGNTFETMISPIAAETPSSAVMVAPKLSTSLSRTSFSASTPTSRRPDNRDSVKPPFRFARRHVSNTGFESIYALARQSISHNRRSLNIQPQFNSSGVIVGYNMTGLTNQSQPVMVSMGCIESLAFPNILFRDARRDLTLISFRFWVISMSVASIIYDSIPHLAVALLGNCAGLGWSISQVTVTNRFTKALHNAITVNACGGIQLGPTEVLRRSELMTASVIVSACLYPVFMFLSYKIFQIYRHQSFQRVGATKEVYNIYTLALGFSVCLHLSGFLVISASLLWLSEMLTGVIRKYLHSTALIITTFLLGIVGNIPWFLMGSNIVFRERKKLMLAFLALGIGLSVLWATNMTNPVFQYTFGTWPFFASLSILSFIFLVATTALGVICRYNFGKGLKHYITVLEVLEEAKFTPGVFSRDSEKAPIGGLQKTARAAALAERDSAVLAGIPILNPIFSTTSSSEQWDAVFPSPSPTENSVKSVGSAPTDRVGSPRSTSQFSSESNGTGVTGLSWSSWLWSRGVAAISQSRTASPTSLTPSSCRASRHYTGFPTSRFSSDSSNLSEASSTTFVYDVYPVGNYFSYGTKETVSEQSNIRKPPLSHSR